MSLIGRGIIFILVMFLAVLSGLQIGNEDGAESTVVKEEVVEKKAVQTEPRLFSKAGEDFSSLVQKSMEVTVDSALIKMQDFISGK